MSDLRESGAIEQDADAILFLFRQDYYQRDKHKGQCEVIVAKNRDGETGFVSLKFEPEHTRFSDVEQYR
jgi:replicative DNA helicase